jgi:hypothetical protein
MSSEAIKRRLNFPSERAIHELHENARTNQTVTSWIVRLKGRPAILFVLFRVFRGSIFFSNCPTALSRTSSPISSNSARIRTTQQPVQSQTPMSSLLPEGKKLCRYEIRSQIGVGGMGEVYLAEDTQLDRKVALKILPPELALKQERMARFVREAKAAPAPNHQTSRISTRLGNRMASTSLRWSLLTTDVVLVRDTSNSTN